MTLALRTLDEKNRLAELEAYGVLDTVPEEAFDRITRLAAQIFAVPVALVTFVDERRQWFKSRYGFDLRETPRDWSFCAHAICGDDLLIVPDASRDDRFRTNPLVTGAPHIRFYAGMPLCSPRGERIGALCVIDSAPRSGLSEAQSQSLRDLAAMVMDELALSRAIRQGRSGFAARGDLLTSIQSAFQDKSDLLANISHELRNPLNAILGYTDLLLSEPHGPLGDARYRDYLAAIQASGGHMLSLVTDILEYAKLRGGTAHLTLETVDLCDVLDETRRILAHLAEEKGLELHFPDRRKQGVPALIEADMVKIRQIFLNLVSNAIKFTPVGGTVTVEFVVAADRAEVIVRDTGIGIRPLDMVRIFTPFARLGGKGETPDGFGLGLSITKGLVERHGGNLEIASIPDVGTEIHVFLPLKHPVADTDRLDARA